MGTTGLITVCLTHQLYIIFNVLQGLLPAHEIRLNILVIHAFSHCFVSGFRTIVFIKTLPWELCLKRGQ